MVSDTGVHGCVIQVEGATYGGGRAGRGRAGHTVTTRRRPSRTSRSERLSSSFLSCAEGSGRVGALRALLASRAASRVRSRAVERDQ